MGADAGFLGRLGPELLRLLPMLDERSRRLAMGMAAAAAGEGGTSAVAALAGASWQTVADGKAELESGEGAAAGRVRRPGGGRKLLEDADPGLLPALESLIRDAIRGDPVTPLLWTTRSLGHLSGELAAAGHRCSPAGLRLVMRRAGYTLQSNARAQEGRRHPERDGQFRHIAARSAEYLAAGDPVISVDAKKKELVGNFGQDGREWGPAGEPVLVRDHDFPGKDQQHAIPYGIWDEKGNAGFVNVGTGGNTAALAVESIRRWWNLAGKDAYPDARRLLVTCDAGGSNGYANTAWRAGLADLAAETGLEIEVCHFPPGTSKWNKIEHRLFCQITLAWRGRPLTSYDVIISTIANVTTRTGLTVRAVLDANAHPAGAKPGSGRLRDIEDRYLTRGRWHGEWNYTLHPAPVRDAPPPPEPARATAPPLASRDTLNHPALTGADPAAVSALAAALAIPHAARRDRDNHIRRGGELTGTPGSGRKARNGPADYLHALLIRRHLAVPNPVLAALLGTHKDVLSRQLTRTSALLAAAGLTLPPAAQPPHPPVRALDGLRDYAARHGITINAPPPAADKPPDTTLTTPDTPQTHLIFKHAPGAPRCDIVVVRARVPADLLAARTAGWRRRRRAGGGAGGLAAALAGWGTAEVLGHPLVSVNY